MIRPEATTVLRGTSVGRRQDWITVTTLAVPTVWLAAADGIVCLDLVAVEKAVNGLRGSWRLTGPETAFAVDILLRRGTDRSVISRLLGIDYRTLRVWFPTDETPLCEALPRVRSQGARRPTGVRRSARCGTYYGAQRHRRNRELLCPPCREAKRAADRHYRKHGTYKGAPGVAA